MICLDENELLKNISILMTALKKTGVFFSTRSTTNLAPVAKFELHSRKKLIYPHKNNISKVNFKVTGSRVIPNKAKC